MPTLPFFYLALSLLIMNICTKSKYSPLPRLCWYLLVVLCVGSSLLWSSSYFITVFTHPDPRIAALDWAKKHLAQNSRILTESYDLGILPFQSYFPNVTTFNFYDLDTNPEERVDLNRLLATSDILLLPSQRVIKNRLTHPEAFPKGSAFYTQVTKGESFEKVYETPCDIFCHITYLNSPIFSYEETASVFDRPTVQMYKIHEK